MKNDVEITVYGKFNLLFCYNNNHFYLLEEEVFWKPSRSREIAGSQAVENFLFFS
jgi:hypothetical protein